MEALFQYSNALISETKTDFVRYMYHRINWSNRLLGIVGPSGVGKTTMTLQHIREHLPLAETLYVSAEDF